MFERITDFLTPLTDPLGLLAEYGWYLVGCAVLLAWLAARLRPTLERWRLAREDAEYHKDPDKLLRRAEAMQRARARQQELLDAESARAAERQREREERKREEVRRLLEERGGGAAQRLGGGADYLPLSGGASASNYRAPKKSKCGGGGCGR